MMSENRKAKKKGSVIRKQVYLDHFGLRQVHKSAACKYPPHLCFSLVLGSYHGCNLTQPIEKIRQKNYIVLAPRTTTRKIGLPLGPPLCLTASHFPPVYRYSSTQIGLRSFQPNSSPVRVGLNECVEFRFSACTRRVVP